MIFAKNQRRYSREQASQSFEENSIQYSFASLGPSLSSDRGPSEEPHVQAGVQGMKQTSAARGTARIHTAN